MQENQTEKKSVLQVVIHSFFVGPFIIAIFAVIIFLVIRLMTTEPNSARDYLEDVKITMLLPFSSNLTLVMVL